MSTARLNPPRVLLDDSSPSNTSPPEPGKAYIPLTPPTGLSLLVKEPFSLEDTGAQTFIVDLKSLGDDDSKSAPVREHQIDVNHPPSPPHELPKEDPLPFPSVNSNATPPGVSPTSNSSDSTSISTPIQPPGLPLLGESQTDNSKSAPVGEHSIDVNHLPPPHELPEQDPLPFPSVASDATPAGVPSTSNSSDSASIDTPIQPTGLLLRVDANPVEADKEEVLSAVEDRDTGHATSSCFSLTGLETLRTCIPDDLFPEDLLVHDPNNLTNLGVVQSQSQSQSSPDTPVRYVRIFPKILREGGSQSLQKPAYVDRPPAQAGDRPVRAAHLYLKNDNKLGGGHHSSVYSAPLRLRLNPESHEESIVRVAVKTADARCGAHKMLRREAAAYNAFPRHLMEDRLSDGGAHPAAGEAEDAPSPTSCSNSYAPSGSDAGDERPHTPMHQPAVVPKFFGYYAAVDADGNAIDHWHPSCDIDDRCRVSGWPTRLLLVEECGKPIVLRELPYDQRKCCLELFKRLHAAGFTQGSIYARNILVQPGPLSAPPEERSAKTPSFRIIDFGRVRMRAELSPGRFSEERVEEEEWAVNVLM